MKIELKNVKYSAFASEETYCFTASVYVDGKRAGEVSNAGQGGCNNYHPRELEETLNQHAATLPPLELDGQSLTQDADLLIGNLMDQWLSEQERKRMCRNKTLARLPKETYAEGEWTVFNTPFTEKVRETVIKKYGAGVVFLNDGAAS